MQRWGRAAILGVAVLLVVVGCAPPAGPRASAGEGASTGSGAPKRLTAAIRGNPHTVYQKLNPRSNIPGIDVLERLVNTGLTVDTPDGTAREGRLADAAPTLQNGLWKLFPDGRMEMTWTLRPGVVWHDGTSMTTDDLLFTIRVVRDRNLPIFGSIAYQSLDTVEAIDERTVVARWKSPYVKADGLFGFGTALPIPKHRLEEAYLTMTDQEQFIANPYWSVEFVGTGPFRIKEWEAGSHLVFQANEKYLLGRPKIDEIVVRFIPDPNTLGANLLAGEVDAPWGGRTDIEWAMNVAEQWKEGKLYTSFASMIQIYPQFINPTPPIISQSAEFRRAMVYALDRQTMADVLQFGLTEVGHTFLSPKEPEYPFIDSAIVKYDFDPRKSLQMLESLGYTRGPDGGLRNRQGQRLAFQIRTSQGDVTQEKGMYASADDWQRLGIEVERHLVVPQRASDAEYRATFPGFDLKRQAGTMDYATSFHSSRIALPENNYLVSGNNSRYSRPEMDQAIDRWLTTIPWDERMQWAREVVRLLSEDVGWIGMYHLVGPELMPNRLLNADPNRSSSRMFDNLHEWDVR